MGNGPSTESMLPNQGQYHMQWDRAPPAWLSGFIAIGKWTNLGVEPKIGGTFPPKMDGENKGSKPYEQIHD